ncbi:MAG TPA: protease pro-enzyme activation domain-containing protein [Armatimonadota bacterium]|nr:protease pro-enzyme activation domain-containing protein [Armatimonadota bacterium]
MLNGGRGSRYNTQNGGNVVQGLRRRLLLLALAMAAMLAIALPQADAQVARVRLPGYGPNQVAGAHYMGQTDPTQPLQLALTLPLRNQPELHDLIRRLYNPLDPLYGHYLTPDEFDARFAPTETDYQTVAAFAVANGFAITATHRTRTILDVAAPAALIERAFSLHLGQFQAPDGRVFHAPDVGPAIPAALVGRLSGVVGLSNAVLWHSNVRLKPHGSNANDGNNPSPNNTGPAGGFGPADIRQAYNLNGPKIPDGTGQTLGLFELDGYTASDITFYEDTFGLPHIPLTNVLVDGFNGLPSGNGGEVEVTLDIDMQAALAPKAKQIIVYEAPNSFAAVVDLYDRIATDDAVQSISTSWGIFEPYLAANLPSLLNAESASFMQMAAQGQSMFAASGDFGAFADGTDLGCSDPAAQPYVVGVGGTSLFTTSSGDYLSETTWDADTTPTDGASGGGISVFWPIPSWQNNVISAPSLGSTTFRNVPDVSLDADPNTGYDIYLQSYGGFFTIGGTSAAAPLWSSFMALVNQSRAGVGLPNLGFPNPVIYSLAKVSAYYGQEFHDIADGSSNIFYPAVAGYDDATGWGTFNGANLLADLTVPPPPSIVTAKPGDTQVALSWSASPTATGYNVKSSLVKGGPYTTLASNITTTTYTDTGLTNGTLYYYVVSALDGTAEGGDSREVSAMPNHVPLAPSGLTATYANGAVTLKWTAGMYDSTYSVLRGSTSGGPYTSLKSGITSTTFDDAKALPDTTYFYVVTAANNVGVSGDSNEASITLPPDAPANPKAAAGNAQVTVSWDASVAATGYNVKRSTVDKGPYTTVGATTSATSFVDKTGLTNGTTYYYVVSATDTNGEGPDSTQVSATPLAPPDAPTSLMAAPTDSAVTLTWTAPARAETYNIKRSLTSGSGYLPVQTGVSKTTYVDTGLINGTQYFYVVSASGVGGEGSDSNEASATPVPRPGVPTGLSANPSNAQVQLSWNTTPTADSYSVKRSVTSGSGYTTLKSGLTTPTYNDTTVKNGTRYYYVVSATNVGGESPNSVEVSATPMAPPDTPDGVIATPSNQQITVTWNPAARAATYTLERSDVPGGGYKTVASGLTLTHFVDTGLTNGSTYFYVVSASNVGGDSGRSLEVSATPLPPPPAPVNLAAAPGNAQVALSWTGSSDAASYQVDRGDAAGGPYTTVASVGATSFTDTKVTNGTTYFYVVTAVNLGGESGKSNEVSAEPLAPPDTPTGLAATAGPAQVTLAWTAAPRAATYTITRAEAFDGSYAAIANSATSTGYTDSSVTNGTTYYYKVSATNVGGQSQDSDPAHATPEALPAVPDGVAAAPGDAKVLVAWNPATNALMYELKRSVSSGGPYTMVNPSITSNSYVDNGVTNGTKYYYVVSSMGAVGPSADSAEVNATPTPPPGDPTNLTAVAVSTSEIDLSWTGDKAARFAVNRSTDGVNFSQVGLTPTGAVSFADTGLSAGTLYTYRLKAIGIGGASGDSNTTSATTLKNGSVSSGISMVSVPYIYSGGAGDAAAVFGLTTLPTGFAPVAIYNPVSNQYNIYPNLPGTQVQAGRGYWVRESGSGSAIAPGTPVASPFTENLLPGWNMIGNPFTQSLDVSSLQLTAASTVGGTPAGTALTLQAAKSAGLIGSPFWGYDPSAGAYAQATALQPFQGYWVYLDPTISQNQPVKITFTKSGS